MMAALLRGRAQYTIGEMRHRNHLLLYTHILGLLELLQPHLFTAYTQALADVFQPYFQLFKVSCRIFVVCLPKNFGKNDVTPCTYTPKGPSLLPDP